MILSNVSMDNFFFLSCFTTSSPPKRYSISSSMWVLSVFFFSTISMWTFCSCYSACSRNFRAFFKNFSASNKVSCDNLIDVVVFVVVNLADTIVGRLVRIELGNIPTKARTGEAAQHTINKRVKIIIIIIDSSKPITFVFCLFFLCLSIFFLFSFYF
jgi:hypothetical protein